MVVVAELMLRSHPGCLSMTHPIETDDRKVCDKSTTSSSAMTILSKRREVTNKHRSTKDRLIFWLCIHKRKRNLPSVPMRVCLLLIIMALAMHHKDTYAHNTVLTTQQTLNNYPRTEVHCEFTSWSIN